MADQNTPAPADLVEAVARALCQYYGQDPDGIAYVHGSHGMVADGKCWTKYTERAQAAITAMQAYMASDGVTQADNDMTVKLTMTLRLTDAEQSALEKLMEEQALSKPSVFRQALRSYQLDHERRKAGETVIWSGDAQRARDFAGPLYGKHQPDPRDAEIERLRLDVEKEQALQDSAYKAGLKAGWNLCVNDDHEGYAKATESTEHIAELKRIREARAALAKSEGM